MPLEFLGRTLHATAVAAPGAGDQADADVARTAGVVDSGTLPSDQAAETPALAVVDGSVDEAVGSVSEDAPAPSSSKETDSFASTDAAIIQNDATGAEGQTVDDAAATAYGAESGSGLAADHDGDDCTEVTILYDLYSDNTGLYVFEPNDTGVDAPQRVWLSAPRSWDWKRSKTPEYNFTLKTYNLGISWLDINLSNQVVSAIGVLVHVIADGYIYYSIQPVFSTLASTGGPGMATPTGVFHVYAKYVAIDMSGPGYYAPNVPYVLWFTGPYSIHGTYWHNSFGWPHTHGCVNLPTPAAHWLFDRVPVGMRVVVHY